MNNLKITKLNPLLKDSRGSFFEVMNNDNINHIVVTTFTKNAVRGNQYRNNMDQYFFLISGKAKLLTKPIENENIEETLLEPGSLIFIPRKTVFVTIAQEESILLEYSPQAYDPKNPDINRVKLI